MTASADEVAALRLRVRRLSWPALGGADVESALRDAVRRERSLAASRGEEHLLSVRGRVAARVAWYDDPKSWNGEPVTHAFVDADPSDIPSLVWALERLEVLAEKRARTLEMACDAALGSAVLPVLARYGVGVDSLLLIGECAKAKALLGDVDIEQRLASAGVTLREAESDDVDALVDIQRSVFRQVPEYCWFGASEAYLESLGQELAASHDGHPALLFEKEGRALGWFHPSPPRHAEWGPCGGVGVVLLPELQGRGLLRAIYSVALTRLESAGVPWFRGGTSHPNVLRMARQMGRVTIGAHLRQPVPFPLAHFDGWFPAVDANLLSGAFRNTGA